MPGPLALLFDEAEKQVPERPVHHFLEAAGIVSGHLAHDRSKVAEVYGAALAVRRSLPFFLEDFGELVDDRSPNEKKPIT